MHWYNTLYIAHYVLSKRPWLILIVIVWRVADSVSPRMSRDGPAQISTDVAKGATEYRVVQRVVDGWGLVSTNPRHLIGEEVSDQGSCFFSCDCNIHTYSVIATQSKKYKLHSPFRSLARGNDVTAAMKPTSTRACMMCAILCNQHLL